MYNPKWKIPASNIINLKREFDNNKEENGSYSEEGLVA